ncbi:MAG: hypothetical protein AAGD35_12935 [Actinomycetota bacterium]
MTDVVIDRTAAIALVERLTHDAERLDLAGRELSAMAVHLPIVGAELAGIGAEVGALRRSVADEAQLLDDLLRALAVADVVLFDDAGPPGDDLPHRPSLVEAAVPFVAGRLVDAVTVAQVVVDAVTAPWSDDDGADQGRRHAGPGGDLGGTYGLRALAPLLSDVTGGDDRARAALVDLVAETGTAAGRIGPDEFELIRHDAETWTVVLPGVVDLRAPHSGLDPAHRSVRDLDASAVAASLDPDPSADPYARMVAEAVTAAGVPPGASLLVVGHSYGAGAAVRLSADREFNGRRFRVTHVLAAGYHVDPWLDHVPPTTSVLSVENRRDLVVAAERAAHELTPTRPGPPLGIPLRPPAADRRVIRFNGGWSDAGHHQRHYEEYLASTSSPTVQDFIDGVASGGYDRPGAAWAVDVSVPEGRHPASVARD